ncbi:hypothetical protein [Anatilimnocola floriformis]|uniref:hypothetical protein n=1 Tax=Anatilimnocola floriformis TaxID=2948575 RepID=UPI0020C4D302|nr:hypothetical protein [Anatilimnocola floriformis]
MPSQISIQHAASWLLGVVCLLSLTGCSEKLVTVKGKVLNNQQPLPLSPTGSVQVTLIPDVPPGSPYTTYPGRADATGSFAIEEKVKPGKYRVAVEHNDPLPGTDKLMGKFSPANTKIVREIVDEKTPLSIDLSMP